MQIPKLRIMFHLKRYLFFNKGFVNYWDVSYQLQFPQTLPRILGILPAPGYFKNPRIVITLPLKLSKNVLLFGFFRRHDKVQ
jgi:hypothetical protein